MRLRATTLGPLVAEGHDRFREAAGLTSSAKSHKPQAASWGQLKHKPEAGLGATADGWRLTADGLDGGAASSSACQGPSPAGALPNPL